MATKKPETDVLAEQLNQAVYNVMELEKELRAARRQEREIRAAMARRDQRELI